MWTLGSCGQSSVGTSSLLFFNGEFNHIWMSLGPMCLVFVISSHPDNQGALDGRSGPRPGGHRAYVLRFGVHTYWRGSEMQGQLVSDSQRHPSARRWGFWNIFLLVLLVFCMDPHVFSPLLHTGLSDMVAYCLYIHRVVGAFLHNKADPSTMR